MIVSVRMLLVLVGNYLQLSLIYVHLHLSSYVSTQLEKKMTGILKMILYHYIKESK